MSRYCARTLPLSWAFKSVSSEEEKQRDDVQWNQDLITPGQNNFGGTYAGTVCEIQKYLWSPGYR